MAKANSLIDFIGDQVDKTNVLIQFFGRKQMYELKNYDLDQIDTQIFKTINQPAEDTEKAVRNILFSNTQAIIENFEIQVARQIYQKLFTSTLEAPDALMKEIFLKFFRYKENDLYQPILEYISNSI